MPIRVEEVADGLRSLGLQKGDVVYFHSHLPGLAPAKEQAKLPNCGADLVIDAFVSVVGPGGIVSVPTHSRCTVDPQTREPRNVYDRAATPSVVGSVTNVLRLWAGAARSAHPTHSVAAIGERAAEFVAGHDTGETFARGGPHGKLVDWGGKICWFNTQARTHTMTHAVEAWMELPYMGEADAAVRAPDGGVQIVHLTQFPSGPRDFYKREGSKLSRVMDESGLLTRGRIGGATVTMMDAAATCEHIKQAIIADPLLLVNDDRPDDPWVIRARELTPEHVRRKYGDG